MLPVRLLLCALAVLTAAASVRAGQDAASPSGWVVIPVDQYRSLRSLAYPPDRPPDPPPVEAALTRIEYDLSLADDSVTGTATLLVDVLKDGWVEVAIPAGLLVRDARVDGRPVSLVDRPKPHVLLSKRGRSVLTLEVVLPVAEAGNAESITIPPAPAALVQATLRVPRDGVELRMDKGFVAESIEGTGGSRWTVHGRAHEPLTFTWRRRVDDRRAGQPLRFRGSVTALVGLGEQSTQLAATVAIEVVSGLSRTLTISIPAGIAVTRVSGPLVADWETPQPGSLRVSFIEPVDRRTAFTVSGELRASGGPAVDVPLLRLPEAERETGGVAVEVLGAGEITDRRAQALEPADASDLGPPVARRESPSMQAFRYEPAPGTAPRALTVQVSRYDTQAVLVANVEEARYLALVAEDGKMLVQARYAVRNNRRSLLSVQLPSGATLWSASVGRRAVRPGRSAAGALLVPLQKERADDDDLASVVEVIYIARVAPWEKEGDAQLVLPAIDLPISRTGLVLHHSPRFRVKPEPGAFRVEPYIEPFSPALRVADAGAAEARASGQAPPPAAQDAGAAALQQLVDQFQKQIGRRIPGVLPIAIPFPRFGHAVFLASELTPEAAAASLALEYERQRGD